MAKRNRMTVDEFLAQASHARMVEIMELRFAILRSRPDITEQVKWNAPSFCVNGDDRITFRLQPGDRVELVFHRGAKVRADSDAFAFSDPAGLITWSTPDRGIVVFRDHGHVLASMPALVDLVKRWIEATSD